MRELQRLLGKKTMEVELLREPVSRTAGQKLLSRSTSSVADIRVLVADLPTYRYRRVHALLRRWFEKTGREAPNPKRVYRVMKAHGFLLQVTAGGARDGAMTAASPLTSRTPVGAQTRSRSAATTAKRCASP